MDLIAIVSICAFIHSFYSIQPGHSVSDTELTSEEQISYIKQILAIKFHQNSSFKMRSPIVGGLDFRLKCGLFWWQRGYGDWEDSFSLLCCLKRNRLEDGILFISLLFLLGPESFGKGKFIQLNMRDKTKFSWTSPSLFLILTVHICTKYTQFHLFLV